MNHTHAAALGHTHGLGWTNFTTPEIPANSNSAHRHFILLGIEFGAIPCGTDCCEDHFPNTPCMAPVVDGSVISTDDGPDLQTPIDYSPLLAFCDLQPDITLPACVPPACPHTCPVISHTRTGVLRS